MKCVVSNQDGIEETIDSSVIRLDDKDVIIVKLPKDYEKAPRQNVQKFVDNFRNAFPKNRIIFVNEINDVVILKQSQNMNKENNNETI